MPNCAVVTCSKNSYRQKYSDNGVPLRFHNFPKDAKIRNTWIQLCKREDRSNFDNAVICSEHFSDDAYERDLQGELLGLNRPRKLSKTAIPSEKLPNSDPNKKLIGEARKRRLERRQNKKLVDQILKDSEIQEDPLSPEETAHFAVNYNSGEEIRSSNVTESQTDNAEVRIMPPHCLVCHRSISDDNDEALIVGEDVKEELLSKKKERLKAFFRMFETSYPATNRVDNEEASTVEIHHLEQAINAGMLSCEDCSRLVDSFCELHKQMKFIQQRMDEKAEALRDTMSGGQKNPVRMMEFRMTAKHLKIRDEDADKIIKLKRELVSRCGKKLGSAFPTQWTGTIPSSSQKKAGRKQKLIVRVEECPPSTSQEDEECILPNANCPQDEDGFKYDIDEDPLKLDDDMKSDDDGEPDPHCNREISSSVTAEPPIIDHLPNRNTDSRIPNILARAGRPRQILNSSNTTTMLLFFAVDKKSDSSVDDTKPVTNDKCTPERAGELVKGSYPETCMPTDENPKSLRHPNNTKVKVGGLGLKRKRNANKKKPRKLLAVVHTDRSVIKSDTETDENPFVIIGTSTKSNKPRRSPKYQQSFKNHKTGLHKCNLCSKEFKRRSTFNLHYEGAHLKVKYKCKLCGMEFTRQGAHNRHHQVVHLMRRRFKCDKCGRLLARKEHLAVHFRCCDGEIPIGERGKTPLGNRGQGQSQKGRRGKRQYRSNITNEYTRRCRRCKEVFTSPEDFEKHVKEAHAKSKEHFCDQCGKMLVSPMHLQRHIEAVHVQSRNFVCELCGAAFKRADHLADHRQGVHFGIQRQRKPGKKPTMTNDL